MLSNPIVCLSCCAYCLLFIFYYILVQLNTRKSIRPTKIVQRYTNGNWGADGLWKDKPQQYIPLPGAIVVTTISEAVNVGVTASGGQADDESTSLSTDSVVHNLFGEAAAVSVPTISDCCCNNREDHMFNVPRHNLRSVERDWEKNEDGQTSIVRFNLLLKKAEGVKSWNHGHTGSLNKMMKSKINKLEIITDYLMAIILNELEYMRNDMRQMMMLFVCLSEVDEDEFEAMRDGHRDVMVHIAAKCFLASKELVQMSRSEDDEDVNTRFLSLLNKWLMEEPWKECKYMENCPYLTRRDVDGLIRLPSDDEVLGLVIYLGQHLMLGAERSLQDLRKGYNNIQYSVLEARATRSQQRNGEPGQMDDEMIEFVKQNAMEYIKRTKNDTVEIAVQLAVAGNTLMMLVHGDSFENRGWACACACGVGDPIWFKYHVDGVCDKCGNQKRLGVALGLHDAVEPMDI
jgi:hypothetical protein